MGDSNRGRRDKGLVNRAMTRALPPVVGMTYKLGKVADNRT